MELPTGTVTFLFTDIVGSSRLWEQVPLAMRQAVARHDEHLRAAVVEHRGHVVKMRGDGLHAVFASVDDAVAAAVAGQQALQAEVWDEGIEQMPVRMGVHSGSAQLRDGDYYGPAVNRAARLQDAGHGGQILLSQTSVGLLGSELPEGVTLRDLGRHQIQDFPTPERVYQVVLPGLRDNFPSLRAAGGRRTNLPTPKSSFVGREQELTALKRLLDDARLVTLTGPGGTGKTRLALEIATELFDRYRDGIWLVELASLTEEAMVLPAVAKVFALQPEPQRSLETMLADFLRNKIMLLLLDNCEHLIEACATLAGELLDGARQVNILASSREALGVPGEMILRVPSLSLPSVEGASAESLRHSEAAQLLAERGRAARQGFQITDANAGAVAEICRRLDGIPLAIELAASRLRLFSLQELAARLNDRFRLLTGGSRTALPRQQTLQALIDWSYELLTAEEQALFRRLSVFSGGWTFEAAEAVSESGDILELLDQLVSKSLVDADHAAFRTRFFYLETVRQYARERLFAAGEGEMAREKHFAYFSNLVANEVSQLDGARREQVRAVLKSEMDNFHRALAWQMGRDVVAALDMLGDVVSFIVQDTGWGDRYAGVARADVQEWLELAGTSLQDQEADNGSELRRPWARSWATFHLVSGQSALSAGEFDFARSELAKAIALAREVGEEFMLMSTLGFYAILAGATQRFQQDDIDAAEECLALARRSGSLYYKRASLNTLATYELQRGNDAIAYAYLAEVAKGGGFMSAMASFQVGVSFFRHESDLAKALPYLEESLRLFEEIENAFFVAIATSVIAHVQRRRGELDAAETGYRKSLPRFHWQGHRPAVAHELECLAFIARRRNVPERAARLLGAAEALRRQIEVPMLANEQAEYDLELAALEQAVDFGPMKKAWFEGSLMDIDEAVGYALAEPVPERDFETVKDMK